MTLATIKVHKYTALGDDQLVIDNRGGKFDQYRLDPGFKARLCNRQLGIGANGIVEIQKHPDYPYQMVYHSASGNMGRACGNGSRISAIHAKRCGIVAKEDETFKFCSLEGKRQSPRIAYVNGKYAEISMADITEKIDLLSENCYFVHFSNNTYVEVCKDLCKIDPVRDGKSIIGQDRFKHLDVDPLVCWIQPINGMQAFHIRCCDYEADQNLEVLNCGTGSTASAVAYAKHTNLDEGRHDVLAFWTYGSVKVSFTIDPDGEFTNVTSGCDAWHVLYSEVKVGDIMTNAEHLSLNTL